MSDKLKVGVIGATGMVGQRFITILADHPWFEVAVVAASAHSAGKTYGDAVDGRWKMDKPVPDGVKNMVLLDASHVDEVASQVDFVFSAIKLDKADTRDLEDKYAKTETPVVSNNSAHRWTPDVPMIVPEINPQHADIIPYQRQRLGTERGFVAVKPNCSIQSYTPALSAWRKFEPTQVIATTYQAISGAGKTFKDWPEMVGNVIPYIAGEEEKSEREPLKIWGNVDEATKSIVPDEGTVITSQCIRVPVLYGHTAAAFVNFKQNPTKDDLIEALESYSGEPQELGLPSAPKQFIQYMTQDDRPQVSLDVNFEHGMGISIGRLREDKIFDWKFVGLSHNTARGAAGGAVECAELLKAKGYITAK
ncbi:aspartate-semialdehyde dehydrogenase [Secundilactobacillus collinoides]|uniref:Aspartate-semialdehyde dehydrogenase n=2 Tax=Secundilactobacillus collinoides TaxID=33960 RepID=A0A0R2BKC6_SECCO|nr:aspartate-semialdehyde dehydrogenase [Secundilactobacillus collinoides]KRM76092.1 aspartate-semialdehyde dehydrogenase [Secundilactobacillus collinoides DSM 20515 = JCM 1123]KZL35840.1 aspartate-semialdehyde dehydrogenase [Secundilactobacillus collinoides]